MGPQEHYPQPPPPPPPPPPPVNLDPQYNLYPYPPPMYVPPPPTDQLQDKPAPDPHSHLQAPTHHPPIQSSQSPLDALNSAPPTVFFLAGLFATFLLGPLALCLLCLPPFRAASKWFIAGFATAFAISIVIVVLLWLVVFSKFEAGFSDVVASFPDQ